MAYDEEIESRFTNYETVVLTLHFYLVNYLFVSDTTAVHIKTLAQQKRTGKHSGAGAFVEQGEMAENI